MRNQIGFPKLILRSLWGRSIYCNFQCGVCILCVCCLRKSWVCTDKNNAIGIQIPKSQSFFKLMSSIKKGGGELLCCVFTPLKGFPLATCAPQPPKKKSPKYHFTYTYIPLVTILCPTFKCCNLGECKSGSITSHGLWSLRTAEGHPQYWTSAACPCTTTSLHWRLKLPPLPVTLAASSSASSPPTSSVFRE